MKTKTIKTIVAAIILLLNFSALAQTINRSAYTSLSSFDNGYALYTIKTYTSLAYGLIDKNGVKQVECINKNGILPTSKWYLLGDELSKKDNPDRHLELAIYCYERDNAPRTEGISKKRIGEIYYREAGKNYYNLAFDYYLKASKSGTWKLREFRDVYIVHYTEFDVLHTLAWMYFFGQGTAKSAKDAGIHLEKARKKGEKILTNFSRTQNLSNMHAFMGEIYEMIGDKKRALQYYKRSSHSAAAQRIKAVQSGNMYSF